MSEFMMESTEFLRGVGGGGACGGRGGWWPQGGPGEGTTWLCGQIALSFKIVLAALETDVHFSVKEGKDCWPEGPV